MASRLVLVSGAPGAGKTTLARRLAGDLGFALLTKDTIKEALGEVLPAGSLDRSRQLGRAAVGALYALAGEQLELGVPVVVESAFHQDLAGSVAPMVERARAVLVHCTAPERVLARRLLERSASGARHSVHADDQRESIPWDRYRAMELDVPTLFVDTADGYRPDYPTILRFAETGR